MRGRETRHATAQSSSWSRTTNDGTRTSEHLLQNKATDDIPDPAHLLEAERCGASEDEELSAADNTE